MGVTPVRDRTASTNAFPRTSKFGYWSNEAQAGDSSTTGSFGVGRLRRRARRRRPPAERAVDLVGTLPSSVLANSAAASPIR